MEQDVKEVLESILAKDKAELDDQEKAFLLARRSYLNEEQRARYADLIKAHEDGLKGDKKAKKDAE